MSYNHNKRGEIKIMRYARSIAFEPEIFEWLENARGRHNRSKFISELLHEQMKNTPPQ